MTAVIAIVSAGIRSGRLAIGDRPGGEV
jgi:hypothetical protein